MFWVGLVEGSLLLVVVEAAQRLVVKHAVVPTVVNPEDTEDINMYW